MTTSRMSLQTARRDEVQDLTRDIERIVADSGVSEGVCLIYCPHTTAGIVINEGYDPDVAADVLTVLDRLVPWEGAYRHAEGNTASHVKAILCGTSQTVVISGGRLQLGRWQAIQFYEFDGPRSRQVMVTVMEASR